MHIYLPDFIAEALCEHCVDFINNNVPHVTHVDISLLHVLQHLLDTPRAVRRTLCGSYKASRTGDSIYFKDAIRLCSEAGNLVFHASRDKETSNKAIYETCKWELNAAPVTVASHYKLRVCTCAKFVVGCDCDCRSLLFPDLSAALL